MIQVGAGVAAVGLRVIIESNRGACIIPGGYAQCTSRLHILRAARRIFLDAKF